MYVVLPARLFFSLWSSCASFAFAWRTLSLSKPAPAQNDPSRWAIVGDFDAIGRVATATDERGYVTTYTCDAADYLRQVDLTAPNGTLLTGERIQMTYDAAGRLLTISDSSGSRTYAYDGTLKRLHSVTTVLTGLPQNANTAVLTYAYFPDGSLQTQTLTVAGNNYVTVYTYDAAGQLTALTDPVGNVTTWQYDHSGRATQQSTLTRANRTLTTAYTWGVSNQPGDLSTAPAYLQHIHQTAGTSFWDYELRHSYLGQIQQQTGSGAQVSSDAFTFDGRGRLQSEGEAMQAASSGLASVSATYGYDLANNVLPQIASGAVWNYNTSSQLTSAPASSGLAGATGLNYDAAGNLTSANGVTLGYDGWGQLNHYGATTYTYDASGRRVHKSGSGGGTYYLYAGDTLLAELNGSGQITRLYVWGALGLLSDTVPQNAVGGGIGGAGNLASRGAGSNSVVVTLVYPDRFYFFDGLGNTRALVDANGSLLGRGAYSAWGKALSSAYSPSTPFGYKGQFGQYKDSESGLLYCQARYYAPSLGRFVSRDPSGFSAGPNLYAYCGDDPADFFDATGLVMHPVQEPVESGSGGGFLAGVDDYLLGGSMAGLGEAVGKYETGKGSALGVAAAAGKFALNAASTACALKDLGAVGLRAAGRGINTARELTEEAAARRTPTHYPSPDPPMSEPPVRYDPQTPEELERMRLGKGPIARNSEGTHIEAHHRQQVPIEEGGVMDEVTAQEHRLGGNHARHNQSSRLSASQRAREIRRHWIQRGSEYYIDGEGI